MLKGFQLSPCWQSGLLALITGFISFGLSQSVALSQARTESPPIVQVESHTSTPAKVSLKEVQMALKPDRNPNSMLRSRQVLAAELGKALGVPVKVIVPSSGAIIQQAFLNRTLDLAFVSTTDFLLGVKDQGAIPLLAAKVRGKTTYESIWLVRQDSPYQSIADLKGKPIAFASRTSTSGYFVPWAHLIKQGYLKKGQDPEAFFGKRSVSFGTGYVSAVERLLQGLVEAAAVSDYVYDLDQHLNAEQKAKLRVLARQGPVPTHIMIVRSQVSQADRQQLKQALQALPEALAEELFSGSLVEVNEAEHLAPLQEVFSLTGAKK
jgi:phosphonate transport system substrate-binding protein